MDRSNKEFFYQRYEGQDKTDPLYFNGGASSGSGHHLVFLRKFFQKFTE